MSSASAVSTTYTGLGEGQIVYGTDGLYEQAMVQNTTGGPTFCISINTPIYPGDLLNETTYSDAVANSPGGELTLDALHNIYRIVVNTYPNDNPSYPLAGDNDQKAASVQSAIWSYSNDWDLDPSEPRNDATVVANYNLIHQWLDGDASNGELPAFGSEPVASLSVDPASASGATGDDLGPFTVHINGAGSKVKVVVTDGVAVDSTGTAIDPNFEYSDLEQFYITRDSAGVATATVAGSVVAPPGIVFRPLTAEKQLLIGLMDIQGESEAQVEATFEDPGTIPTTTPEVLGTSVSQNTASGVSVQGESVSRAAAGTLANTGLNGMSIAAFAMAIAMLVMGLTLSALAKLREIHPV